MRGLYYAYDPFNQVRARIQALEAIGHPTDKIELLILGGTWSAYKVDYQRWFVKRCLDALNDFEASDLGEGQFANQNARHKNVGMVIETRPDHISRPEIAHLRDLGVTKVQLGVQSLDNRILAMNARGHSVEETRSAIGLLRAAGFKIVLHWMPNLLGATLASDRKDFARLWDDPEIRPDELKIYPCQLLEGTELHRYWEKEEYTPYTMKELIELIADLKPIVPRYCRINRVVRDIPSHHIVEGNKRTSLRQDIQRELERRGERCHCIRCREIRERSVEDEGLQFDELRYRANGTHEHFLSLSTEDDRLVGYLRLSLPETRALGSSLKEIEGAAMVREVHVYGQSIEVGETQIGAAQHVGLGESLLQRAEKIARTAGYKCVAVISALGTRGYYARFGYILRGTYMVKDISK
jgi:elongator complex protein 3